MANPLFSSNSFDSNGFQDGHNSPPRRYEKEKKRSQDHFSLMEEPRRSPSLCPERGNCGDGVASKELHFFKDQQELAQQPPKSNYLSLDDYLWSCFPAPSQPLHEIRKLENIFKHRKDHLPQPSTVSSSLELLNSYGSGIKKLNLNQSDDGKDTACSGPGGKLSTEEVIRVAGARYIQFSDRNYDEFSMLMHPFGYALSGISEQETWNVELAHLLLTAAEKVGFGQFDRASRLLSLCEWNSSKKSNPVQRVVYYFAEALRERIEIIPKDVRCKTAHGLSSSLAFLTHHQNVPINQVIQLTAIQSIIENIGSAEKLHVVDLEIRSGVVWTALMQALAERELPQLRHLKITAVGRLRHRGSLNETGMRLENFARSVNIPFSYKVVYFTSCYEIREEQFDLAADESLIVSSHIMLRTMIWKPDCLENLMRVIKNMSPSLMVVTETEANINSPAFFTRFIEALFYYSAHFDCLNTCMSHNIEHRNEIEATFAHGIRDIVAMEGYARIARSVNIDVWRAFFSKFRMVEIGFSESSLYQANLVLKQFPHGNLCNLDKNDKALLFGWKGTPLFSLSAWKFSRDRLGRLLLNLSFGQASY
ncbi:hypothetical protein K2173_025194 [Erythroxylum novogranatense]|uniref:Uncharacterized protein n=1 Tax=Erythroxylum novogranatense TaxID=1862640 RepID=A0AAV8UGH9_9ROSI|nr:hypothetical protein K2173_025194 [Erythroxylum novogranatense]